MRQELTLQFDAAPIEALVQQLIDALSAPVFESVLGDAFGVFLGLLKRSSFEISDRSGGAATVAGGSVIRLGIGRNVEFVAAACAAAERESVHGVALVVESWSRTLDSTAEATPPSALVTAGSGSEGVA